MGFLRFSILARLGLLLVAGTILADASAAQPTTNDAASLRSSDLFRLRTLGAVTISPTGRNVAYTVRRSTSEGRAAPPQLYVASLSGRTPPRRLTRLPHGASQPDWGPDGNWLAFVRPVRGVPQVFLLSLSGGEAYQLTDTRHGATQPQWGPQGERVLFASTMPQPAVQRYTEGLPPSRRPGRAPRDTIRTVPPDTVVVVRRTGTLTPIDTLIRAPSERDTVRTLRVPDDAGMPERARALPVDSLLRLPPDSLRALLDTLRLRPDTTTVPAAPDTAATPDGDLLQVRRWLDRPRPEAPAVYTGHPFDRSGLAGAPAHRHYFVAEVPNGLATRAATPVAAHPVTRGYRSFGGADWLPGGRQIVVSGTPPASARPDSARRPTRALYLADVDTARTQRLLRVDGYALRAPTLTTDGTTVAFRAHPATASQNSGTDLGLFALDGRSDPQIVTGGFDRPVSSLQWSPDGWYLYATAPTPQGRAVYRFAPFARADTTARRAGDASLERDRTVSRDTFSLDSTMVRTAAYDRMTDSTRHVQALDVTDAVAVYAATDADAPSALYANTISFGNERRLSGHNRWTANRRLGTTRTVTWRPDSLSVPGRLTRPVTESGPQSAPVVVMLHGGASPHPALTWFERQYLAARGMGVAEISLTRADSRSGADAFPVRTVRVLLDSVATRSWVDSTRIGLVGHDRGAGLAMQTAAQGDSIRAVVAQKDMYPRPVAGWARVPPVPPVLSLSARETVRPDTLRNDSLAIADSTRSLPLAQRLRAPVLLVDRSPDGPVVPDGSFARFYRRLQRLGRPVEYVRYDGPVTPAQQRDRVVRTFEFLARFLRSSGPVPSFAR